jgi:hypothetical protein
VLQAYQPSGELLWGYDPIDDHWFTEGVALGEHGTIYVGSRGRTSPNGKLRAVDAADGSEKWFFQTGGDIYAAPTIGTNGVVYVGSTDKKLYAVQGADGPANIAWPQYRRDLRHSAAANRPTLDHTQLAVNMYAGLLINGNVGNSYRIEYVDSLGDTNHWAMIATVTLDRTPYLFFDIESTNATKRYYRALLIQ